MHSYFDFTRTPRVFRESLRKEDRFLFSVAAGCDPWGRAIRLGMAECSPEPDVGRQEGKMGRADSRVGKRRVRPIDFGAFKQAASIVELLESVGWKPVRTRRGGSELRGPCPIHKSGSATSLNFSVTPARKIFKCFKCDAGGDTIALAAYLFGIARDQRVKAAVALCKQLGIEVPRLRVQEQRRGTGPPI